MILSIEEARKLLHLAAASFTVEAEKETWREKFDAVPPTVPAMDLIPVLAVECFGGVRFEESARMTWEMVDFNASTLISRPRSPRTTKESGSLLPMNFPRKRWAFCRAMNWKE